LKGLRWQVLLKQRKLIKIVSNAKSKETNRSLLCQRKEKLKKVVSGRKEKLKKVIVLKKMKG
jgi:hypothetical protein